MMCDVLTPRRQGVFLRLYSSTARPLVSAWRSSAASSASRAFHTCGPFGCPGVLQRARERAPPAGLVPGAGRADLAPGAIRELRDPDATDEDDDE